MSLNLQSILMAMVFHITLLLNFWGFSYIWKGNHKQNEKTTHRMGENICKWSDRQGINLQNIQIVHAAQYKKKNKQPNQKMGEGSK